MKKRFNLFVTFFIVIGVIFCFVGCKEPEPEGPIIENLMNPGADTILFLDKPQVKVIAYPGMNYVSWMPVTNAKSYVLYVYAGDSYVCSETFDYDDELYFMDTDIKNNVKYTYIVEAESASSPGRIEGSDVNIVTSRAVYTQNSKSDGVSVIAIVPEYDTSALELVDYENPAGNTAYIVNSENLHIARHNNNKLSVSLPGKAYLYYDVFLTVGDDYKIFNEYIDEYQLNDVSQNDVTLYTDFTVTQAGKYNAKVVVKSINSHFGDSDVITSSQSVTVEALNGSGGNILSAEYKDFGDAIRVVFDKFELENGSDAPISYYKLYRSEKGSSVYTKVSNEIKPTGDTTDEYFVDDSSIDNTKDYVYTLVVTDGNLYKEYPSTRVVYEYVKREQAETSVYGYFTSEDTIKWTVTIPAGVQFDGLYKLVKPVDYTTDIIPADFDRSSYNDFHNLFNDIREYADRTIYTYYTFGHSIGEKEYLLIVTSQTNKLSKELISDPVSLYEIRTASFTDAASYISMSPTKAIKSTGYYDNWNEIRLPEIPERDGFNTDGYWYDSEGNSYYEGSYVYLNYASTTFTAQYYRTASFFDVTTSSYFDINTVESNDDSWNNIQLPLIPRRDGYYTDGYWYDSEGSIYEGSYVYLNSASTTFTAHYYRIASFTDATNSISVSDITVYESNNYDWNYVQLPSVPRRDGYNTDVYWYDSEGNRYYEDSSVYLYNASTTYTAKYSRIASFTDATNSISVSDITVYESNNYDWNYVQLPSVPRRDGYNTDGYWYDSNGNSYYEGFYVNLDSATKTYTAKYYRTVSFKDEVNNDIVDKIKVTETNNYNWNRVQLPSIPSRVGYISDGYWYDSNGNSYYAGDYVSLDYASATFYPRYIVPESLNMYTNNLLYLNSDSQGYSFSCNAGATYTVSCLDSYEGDSELSQLMSDNSVTGSMVDIRVSIISADGSHTVLTREDNGSCTFIANTTGTYYVIVEPYNTGSTGYFAVRVN